VRLLRGSATLNVTVANAVNGDFFELVVDKHERAMDVFHHPYAHAAARGLEFPSRRLEPEVLPDAA
jgi:hypothetical protein